jgi:glycosyltransferase involved in cell wall biosynthesis
MDALSNLSIVEAIVLGVMVVGWLIQVLYFLLIYIRIPLHKSKPATQQVVGTSVIICAKNEEKNLRDLIPILFEQDHPEFEVVVVNDASWDDTQETLEALDKMYPRLHVINLDENKQYMHGKKFALTLGIKGAQYEHLLLTDADCRPTSKQWIRQMTQPYFEGYSVVLGYSPYNRFRGLLNALIRYDTFQIALSYLSMAQLGNAYMGVGRNMSYTKDLFFKAGGFKSHSHVASGDDDLFINQVATKRNCAIMLEHGSHTTSQPKLTWKAWWKQKRRHLTTANIYKTKHKVLLTIFPFSLILMLGCGIFLLAINKVVLLVIALLFLRYLCQIAIFRGSCKHLGNSDIAWLSPVYEMVLLLMNPVIYLSNILNKPKSWM